MTSLIRCRRCKKKYDFTGSIQNVTYCPDCIVLENEEYALVRNYVSSHRGCLIDEVSRATGVPHRKIMRYLREEKLEVAGESSVLLCENCKTPIRTGMFCQDCARRGGTVVVKKPDENTSGQWRMGSDK